MLKLENKTLYYNDGILYEEKQEGSLKIDGNELIKVFEKKQICLMLLGVINEKNNRNCKL